MSEAVTAPETFYVPPGVRTCYHEAGHAVLAHIVGRRFRSIHFTPTKPQQKGRLTLRDSTVEFTDRTEVENVVMVLLAGEAAESIVIGNRAPTFAEESGNESDVQQAIGLALKTALSQEEAVAHVIYLRLRTINILAQPTHWAAVKALSGELMERKRIGVRGTKVVIEAAMLQPLEPVAGDWGWRRHG